MYISVTTKLGMVGDVQPLLRVICVVITTEFGIVFVVLMKCQQPLIRLLQCLYVSIAKLARVCECCVTQGQHLVLGELCSKLPILCCASNSWNAIIIL